MSDVFVFEITWLQLVAGNRGLSSFVAIYSLLYIFHLSISRFYMLLGPQVEAAFSRHKLEDVRHSASIWSRARTWALYHMRKLSSPSRILLVVYEVNKLAPEYICHISLFRGMSLCDIDSDSSFAQHYCTLLDDIFMEPESSCYTHHPNCYSYHGNHRVIAPCRIW